MPTEQSGLWIENSAVEAMLKGIKVFLVEVEWVKAREVAKGKRPTLIKGGRD
jgi:hypothetical protein